jgi:hypothetical protein
MGGVIPIDYYIIFIYIYKNKLLDDYFNRDSAYVMHLRTIVIF